MKKHLIISLLIFITVSGYSQRDAKTDSVAKLVQKYFNAQNPDSLYALGGEKFHKAISPDDFKTISENNLFPAGKLTEYTFEKRSNGVSMYKAVFENAILSMLLGLDKEGKLEAFLFKPYEEQTAKKAGPVATSNPLETPMDRKIDSTIRSYMEDAATAGVTIGVYRNGKIDIYNYGETKKGNQQLPTANTLYEIGSITKTFTAILLADAVNKGKIKLDDPVNKYLPDSIPALKYNNKVMTIAMLSNHSSGIPYMPDNLASTIKDPEDPFRTYTDEHLFSYLKKLKLTREPGSKFEYSNTAVGLLGVILERVNKKTYAMLLSEIITKPLDMEHTWQNVPASNAYDFVQGYTITGEAQHAWNFGAMAGAGCIRSTVWDMLIYLKTNLDAASSTTSLKKAIELVQQPTFTSGQTKVGLGWFLLHPGDDDLVFHNGQTGGYHAYLNMNKAKMNGVVILSNCAKSMDEAGNQIMAWLEKN